MMREVCKMLPPMLPRPVFGATFEKPKMKVMPIFIGLLAFQIGQQSDLRNMVVSSGFGAIGAIGEIATTRLR